MPTCCVPGCTSGHRNDTSSSARRFFYAPGDGRLRSTRDRAIPRAEEELSVKSMVCDLHFHEQDILKSYVHIINGKSVETPRGKWSLVEGAIPKVFPNVPPYLSKPAEKKRPKRRRDSAGVASHQGVAQFRGAQCEDSQDVSQSSAADGQELSISHMECVELPPSWRKIILTAAAASSLHFSH